jgi:Fe2+ transport system protein FeoA
MSGSENIGLEHAIVEDPLASPAVDATPATIPAEHSLCETCTLDCVKAGEHLEIVSVDDEHARIQALRFGMSEGASVQCITRIPAGPLVLKSGRQEIAVGRSLAKRIRVRRQAGRH